MPNRGLFADERKLRATNGQFAEHHWHSQLDFHEQNSIARNIPIRLSEIVFCGEHVENEYLFGALAD